MWYIIGGIVWYQIIAHVGVSAGLHRYFAHGAFKASPLYEIIALYLITLAGARSPIGWIAAHRMHHVYSDTNKDPHSPKFKGFFTIFFSQWHLSRIPARFSKDLFRNPRIKFFHKNWKYVWGISAIVALAFSWQALVAFIVFPAFMAWIGFGSVNALCHNTTKGESRNVPLINFYVAGEGYHAEHHKGKMLRYHKYDFTGWVLEKINGNDV